MTELVNMNRWKIPAALGLMLASGTGLWGLLGCGLGYLDESDLPRRVVVRIDNATDEDVYVRFEVTQNSPDNDEPSPQGESGETTSRVRRGALTSKETMIRVPPRSSSMGGVTCATSISVTANVGSGGSSGVTFTGVGAGASGFDSGSVGVDGERLLIPGLHFDCRDTLIVRITGPAAGQIVRVAAGEDLPDPMVGDSGGATDNVNDNNDAAADASVSFRLQNPTSSAVDFIITPVDEDGDEDGEPTVIRVPPGQFSQGQVSCGPTYMLSAQLPGPAIAMPVTFTGAGSGSLGFDGGSIGEDGERFLVYPQHYSCGDAVVVTLTGNGGASSGNPGSAGSGRIEVYASGESVPDPDLDTDNDDAAPSLSVTILNRTESFIQVRFVSRTGGAAGNPIDVRMAPSSSSNGALVCADVYSIAAFHLESADSTPDSGFHTVVLTGAGTGTEGFDGNNVGTDNTRLVIIDTHLTCQNRLVVEISATNNRTGEDGGETSYGIGSGNLRVE